jgi:Ca2+-binding EF-hand superfamily protein
MEALKEKAQKQFEEALRVGRQCTAWIQGKANEEAARLYAEYRPEIPMDERLTQIAKEYELTTRDIQTLYRKFLRLDNDENLGRSGDIEVSDFFEWLKCERNELTDGGFEVVNVSVKNTIDFCDFCHSICNFCIMSDEEVLKFVFRCFDKDNAPHGFMVREKFEEMVHSFHKGDSIAYHNAMNALELGVDKELLFLNFDRVKQINKAYPLLLFPAYLYQERLVDASWGQSWWHRKRKQMHFRRKKIQRQVARDRIIEMRKMTTARKKRFKLLSHVTGDEGRRDYRSFITEGLEHGHHHRMYGEMEDIREHEIHPRDQGQFQEISRVKFLAEIGKPHGEWIEHRIVHMQVVGNQLKNPIMHTPSEQLQAWLRGDTPDTHTDGPGNHHFEHHLKKKRHLDFSQPPPPGNHRKSERPYHRYSPSSQSAQWAGDEIPGSIPSSEETAPAKKRAPMTQAEFLEKIGMADEAARVRQNEEGAKMISGMYSGDSIVKVLDAELSRQTK